MMSETSVCNDTLVNVILLEPHKKPLLRLWRTPKLPKNPTQLPLSKLPLRSRQLQTLQQIRRQRKCSDLIKQARNALR